MQTNPPKLRCFYEVLQIPRDASATDIKQAYRKLALEWHPDKNQNSLESVEKFKEIQTAYATLNDPQERSWYDSHRESILRGGNLDSEEDEGINLWNYFTSNAYTGYSDEEQGFYSVYRKVFQSIWEEECEMDELKTEGPSFGYSYTDYKEVQPFYNYWLNFVSKRSFSWCDKYKPSEAPNRKVKRLIEKENKKDRDKARKQRSEEVRHLAEFVKKRDKRAIEHAIKVKKEKEEQEKLELKRKEELQRKRQQKRRVQREEEVDPALLELIQQQEKEIQLQEESQPANGQLYCIACKRAFNSEKQWWNHERSKAHQERVAVLREELLLDDEVPEPKERETNGTLEEVDNNLQDLDLNEDQLDQDQDQDLDQPVTPTLTSKQKKLLRKQKKKNALFLDEDSDTEDPTVITTHLDADSEQRSTSTQPEEPKKKKGRRRALKQDSQNPQAKDGNVCQKCGSTFPSRNQLLKHLQEQNHAVPI